MPFKFSRLEIPDVVLVEPSVFPDERGFFMETYKLSDFSAHGISETFVQDNHSSSTKGILRGLHYQKNPKAQGKLVRVILGEVFDVAVDIRRGSPTYGKWVAQTLSAENRRVMYCPPGFAHGFCVMSQCAEVVYKVTVEFAPETEAGIPWDDPEIGIDWPVANPVLSQRDREWPGLNSADNNFTY